MTKEKLSKMVAMRINTEGENSDDWYNTQHFLKIQMDCKIPYLNKIS